MSDTADRRARLMRSLDQDAFVAYNWEYSDKATIRYLTGFTGEGALIIHRGGAILLTDSRYSEHAKGETSGVEVREVAQWTGKGLAEVLSELGLKTVAFASSRSSVSWLTAIKDLCEIGFVPHKEPVLPLRRIKSSEEVDKLRAAAKIADEAMERLIPEIKIGMTENEIALRLEWLIRTTSGTENLAFDMNVSSGPNSALNHYSPFLEPQPIQAGQLLLFDFGARVDGYNSDITRTFSVGAPTDQAKEIYDLVLRANCAAIEATKAGKTGVEIDAVARDLIASEGHAERFGHGLGHGIGLEVHEAPGLSPRSKDTLEPGMAVTIEPGVYIPGFGGVRIEDDVIVTDDGCEVITSFPKDRLIEVG